MIVDQDMPKEVHLRFKLPDDIHPDMRVQVLRENGEVFFSDNVANIHAWLQMFGFTYITGTNGIWTRV